MICLVYVSSAVQEMKEEELSSLLNQSRDKNKRLNITGMLLYGRGNFIQILEGPKKEVEELYDVITKDDRHKDCTEIFKDEIDERSFSEWSMGFKHLTSQDKSMVEGYTEFLDRKMEPREFATKADAVLELLYKFKKFNV